MNRPALSALLLAFALPAVPAWALEWKTTEATIKAAPLQRTAQTEFAFTNAGTQPVTITSVDTSCDCLEAAPSARTIAPGASGTIQAHFSVGNAVGTLQRMIVVSTDDGKPATVLTVQLEIPEVARFSPRSVEWKLGAAPDEKAVEIVIAEGVEVALHDVQATTTAFALRLETLQAGRHYCLHVTPKSTAAIASAAFRLSGKSADGQDIVVSAYGVVR